MKNQQNKLTDDLFKEGFNHHEMPFDPAAWNQMKDLLDKDEDLKPILTVPDKPIKKNHSLFTILIIMSTLSIMSIAALMVFNSNNSDKSINIHSGSEKFSVAEKSDLKMNNKNQTLSENKANTDLKGVSKTNHALGINKSNIQSNGTVDFYAGAVSNMETDGDIVTSNPVNINATNNGSNPIAAQAASGSQDQAETGNPSKVETPTLPPIDSVYTSIKNGKTQTIVVRKTWIPDEYRYIEIDSLKTVQNGFIGIHFTGQRPKGNDTMSAGFNVQFMSGNRIQNAYWGLYGGFDFGMQFYGKSEKTNVALNNTRQDSGFTRLRSHSIDLFGRGHFEYAKFPIIPYFNIMAGPRFYFTNQQVASYVNLKDNESSTSNNAHTSVSMMYGAGAGLRVRLSPVVSLDFRYELMSGTKVKQVDLNKSTFNGLSYNLVYKKSNPTVEQFKFGVLFDISEREYKKELVTPGHYVTTVYDSLVVDPKDSNKIYIPCNCKPCEQNEYRSREQNPNSNTPVNEDNDNSNGTIFNPSGGGSGRSGNSGGKGAFPGIKPPAPKPAEKTPN